MRIWIDTEFNEFKGDLISIGLIAENDATFYEVVPVDNPGNWVAANVIPILGQQAIPYNEMQFKLAAWLAQFDSVHLIADWPEDVQHFCEALIVGPGMRVSTPPLTMEIRRDLDGKSQLPHHALADAKAIKIAHLELEAKL